MKKPKKNSRYEEARELRHNKGLSIDELTAHYNKSKRTIYRWLRRAHREENLDHRPPKTTRRRTRRYPPECFKRVIKLKREIPRRSTPFNGYITEKTFSIFILRIQFS